MKESIFPLPPEESLVTVRALKGGKERYDSWKTNNLQLENGKMEIV